MLTRICVDFGRHASPKCVVQNVMHLLLLGHLQSLLCMVIQKRHVISLRHLTEGTGSLGGGTYSSEACRGAGPRDVLEVLLARDVA